MLDKGIIWITGASSGIGKTMCEFYDNLGWQVIASSRNQDQLDKIFSSRPSVLCISCDVSDVSSVEEAANLIGSKFSCISHVMVNAGSCEYVDELPIDTSSLQRLMAVNVFGSVNTINAALPLLMRSERELHIKGHVLGICSQVIFAPFTRAELYGASKAAMDYLLHSLRLDLSSYHVDISVIYPGFVDTPLTRKNGFSMPFLQTPEQAAKHIHRAVLKRPRRYVFPKALHASLMLSRVFPSLWENMMLKGDKATMRKSLIQDRSKQDKQ
jgi:short-subunit dehydrogenase